MARQSTTPVHFARSTRRDTSVLMTSGRAGVVVPVGYFPLLAGDSASGKVGVDIQLKEMPKPLLNAVHANVQAWFVPKSAHPRFSGRDELMHSMTGEHIKTLGAADRAPPKYFDGMTQAIAQSAKDSKVFKTLGIHVPGTRAINTDLLDAFSLIYNFRLAAHSSRLTRRKYAREDIKEAGLLPPAFWPSSRFARVVPDYERALLVGALDLDVAAGQVTLTGTAPVKLKPGAGATRVRSAAPGASADTRELQAVGSAVHINSEFKNAASPGITIDLEGALEVDTSKLVASTGGGGVHSSLAQIDKARTTQSFAKLRTAYAGNDATGFDNDDTIVALLMQGLSVPPDQFKRPWLLDSQRVPVGFAERFATDAANLDASVTLGRASVQLSLNVPSQDVGGVVIITVEVLPERIDERQGDPWLSYDNYDQLPNALRDVQRVEPVDIVNNSRIDAKHVNADGLYGYEPMNDRWNRDYTRLGGDFYQPTPGAGWTENRSNIWQTEIVNPTFSKTHYLAPVPFPHTVFADQNADAFEVVCRHVVTVAGLTQIGDPLVENNDDYTAVRDAG